jgi:hypothetical protein
MNTFKSLLPEILDYFGKAELAAADLRPRTLSLCGSPIRITFASEMLEAGLFAAFEHLEVVENNAAPLFRIFVCDRSLLNRDLPSWTQLEDFSAADQKMLMYNSGTVHALYNPDSRVFSLIETVSGRSWYYLPIAADLPYYEKAAPMRMLLHWWCETAGRVLVHAAAIGWASKALLLAGRGGSGKSTTAILAAHSGFSFLGDDYVVLDNARGPAVWSAYNSIKFRWEMLERFPSARSLFVNDPKVDEKGYFYMHRTYPDRLALALPLAAVLLPAIERREKTTFVRLPATRGLLSLAASSIFQMPGSGAPTLKKLADILRETPVYQMSLGTDNEEIAQALRDFLSRKDP